MNKPTTPLGFTGIFIPRDLWLKEDLSATEKLLAAVVDALDQGEGCWASNSYLGGVLGLSERQIRDYLSKLEAHRILIRQQDGEKRRIHSVYAEALRKADLPLAKEDSGAAENRLGGAAESSLGGRRKTATNIKGNKKEEDNTPTGDVIDLSLKGQALDKEKADRLRKVLSGYVSHLTALNRKVTVNSLNAQVEFLKAQSGDWANISIAEEIVTQSIRQGWVGLFPLRKGADAPKKNLTVQDHNGAF
jgi:hypothetical protein